MRLMQVASGCAVLGTERRGGQIVPVWERKCPILLSPNLFRAFLPVTANNRFLFSPFLSPMPRLLGTILANNTCQNCAFAVRVGTGAGGTTILNQQLINGGALLDDWATTSTAEKSVGTVVH